MIGVFFKTRPGWNLGFDIACDHIFMPCCVAPPSFVVSLVYMWYNLVSADFFISIIRVSSTSNSKMLAH